MGGGFGAKNYAGPHTYLAALFARRLGRPVRCVLDRAGEQTDTGHRNATRQRVTAAADAAGRLVALDLTVDAPMGVGGWAASAAAVAHQMYDCPNVRSTETTNAAGEREFNVRFYSRSERPVDIKIDSDLYVRSWGGPIYGSSLGGSTSKESMELWYPLIEKAYAQWKGSYDTIGNGGSAGRVMSEVLGRSQGYEWVSAGREDALYTRIQRDIARGVPMAAGTHGTEKGPVHYTNTGVFADHAYSIVGYQTEGSKRFVVLRNPWGDTEPRNNGPDDGVFKVDLEKFMRLFANVMTIAKA